MGVYDCQDCGASLGVIHEPWCSVLEGQAHNYRSTACHHGQHPRCRHTCKFCEAPCRCNCHALAPNKES